jgi:hypothetical protein
MDYLIETEVRFIELIEGLMCAFPFPGRGFQILRMAFRGEATNPSAENSHCKAKNWIARPNDAMCHFSGHFRTSSFVHSKYSMLMSLP